MLEELKKRVLEANLELPRQGLVLYTWGNASGIDREKGLVVIKAQGIRYEEMNIEHMIVVDMDGQAVEGNYSPSMDLKTHLVLYKSFKNIGGVVHTHSTWSTIWAQAGKGIPCFGTTHANYFHGEIPCTRLMTGSELSGEYEYETGKVIVEAFEDKNPDHVQACLVNGHGAYTWGEAPEMAVNNSVVLEHIAKTAHESVVLTPNLPPIARALMDRHYMRYHKKNANGGQSK